MIDDALRCALEKHLIANKHIRLTDNKSHLNRIIDGLMNRKAKFGDYFCPCKVPPKDLTNTADVCPCADCVGDVKRDGHCACRLFVKNDK